MLMFVTSYLCHALLCNVYVNIWFAKAAEIVKNKTCSKEENKD